MKRLLWFAVILVVLILGLGVLALRGPWAWSPQDRVAIVNHAFSPT